MKSKTDIWYLVSAGVLFGLFLLNIFVGKAALIFDKEPFLSLGDVGEFLILLAAVVFFVIEVLRLELQQSEVTSKSSSKPEEDTQ